MAHRFPDLMIVGNPEEFHVGSHFRRAAAALGWHVYFCDARAAYEGPSLPRAFFWRWGRRPLHLARFSQTVLDACDRLRPTYLLATGLAPIRFKELSEIAGLGTITINYLTDDPWNVAHHSTWFSESLREYRHVFSPRRANLEELRRHGCRHVCYLPFAYSPDVHFSDTENSTYIDADILFAGGADADRVPYIRALMSAGLKVALCGGYWERYRDLRPHCHGKVDLKTLRTQTRDAKIALCLVRRANRDGHAMRTFEAPAMGGCVLIEDTAEHRDIFGSDGECVTYFRSIDEMVARSKWLLSNDQERKRLAVAARARIVCGNHTYADRLEQIRKVVCHD